MCRVCSGSKLRSDRSGSRWKSALWARLPLGQRKTQKAYQIPPDRENHRINGGSGESAALYAARTLLCVFKHSFCCVDACNSALNQRFHTPAAPVEVRHCGGPIRQNTAQEWACGCPFLKRFPLFDAMRGVPIRPQSVGFECKKLRDQ